MAKNSTTTSLQKYGGFDLDEATEDERELAASGGANAFLKILPGKTKLRFIPPLPGKKWRRVSHVHYVDVPGSGRASFVCPRLEAKRHCRLCTQANKLLATGNDIDERKGKKLLPQRRCYSAVIDRNDPEAGARIYAFGRTVEQQLIEIRKDEDEGGDFVNPVDGIDITIIRKGTGALDTRYTVRPGKRCALDDDAAAMNELIATQPNLEKWCRVPSDEEIDAILKGEDPREARRNAERDKDDDDDDDDARGAHRPAAQTQTAERTRPSKTQPAKRRVEDDMDDVDDD